MGSMEWRAVGAGLFFLFIFVSGIWLRRSGRPLNGLILTIHKLISLAAGVFLIITLYRVNQAAGLGTVDLVLAAVAGLCFVAMAASGGLLSTGKPQPAAIRWTHGVMSALTALATAAMLASVGL